MLRRFATAGLLLLGIRRSAAAQGVIVAPHAVYLNHLTRSASIILYNPGAEPTEVTISLFFGYPVTDSLGHFTLRVPDSAGTNMPSATAWIEAFPHRMILGPLQRQTVRLLARPPENLADGEYWSRIAIAAKAGTVQVKGADSAGIQVGLTLEVRTIIPLLYRKGPLQTGISLTKLAAVRDGDSLDVRAHLQRLGTAAYIGTAQASLVSERGTTVASLQQPVAIYYDADPVFKLGLPPALPPGRYHVRMTLTTERTDIAPELLLRAAPVADSTEVAWP